MKFILLAQDPVTVAAAAKEAGSLLQDRSDAMLIVAMIAALIGLWIWKVIIPERASKQESEKKALEIQAKLAETIAELGKMTGTIHETTTSTATQVKVILKTTSIKVECLRKLATTAGIDIKDELSQIKGMLHISDDN